jgi:CheY-like chemotaxis protein
MANTSTAASPNLPRKRVLLVDDNADGIRAMARVLDAMGYEVTTVVDGKSALEVLQVGPPPDFLLTDLRLPDLDGREIARFAGQLVPRPYVVLVTGWDPGDDLEDPSRWGIDQLFLKPVLIDDLLTKLAQVTRANA